MTLAATTMFATLEATLTAPLVQFANETVVNQAAYVSGPLKAGFLLYVVCFAIMLMLGQIQSPLSVFVLRCAKIGFLVAVLQPSWYSANLTQFLIVDFPNALASAVTNASGHAAVGGSSFDAIYDQGNGLAATAASGWTVSGTIQAAVVWCMTALFTGVGFFIVMYAKISLGLLVALGPLFLACFAFDQSRPIGEAWVKTVVSYTVLQLLAAGLGALVISASNAAFQGATALDTAGRVSAFMCIGVVGAMTFGSLPHIAQMLGGAGVGFAHAAGGPASFVSIWMFKQGMAVGGRAADGSRLALAGPRAAAAFNSSPQGVAMNQQTSAINTQTAALQEAVKLMQESAAGRSPPASTGTRG